MKPSVSKVRIGLLLIFLVTVSSVFMACEPGINIRVHNQTAQTLKIFTGDTFIEDVLPGGEIDWEVVSILPKYTITAKDMDGNVLYTANYTRDDFKGKKTYDVYFPPLEDEGESSDNVTGE